MAMKLVKKTDEYSIFQRGDERYAVKDANRKPVNGEEKVRILSAEGLVKAPAPKPVEAPAEEVTEEATEEATAEADAPAAEGDAEA